MTFTVADELLLGSLTPEVREAIERRVAHEIEEATANTDELQDSYEEGFEDGVEAIRQEIRDAVGRAVDDVPTPTSTKRSAK